jgi:hypothetical protein
MRVIIKQKNYLLYKLLLCVVSEMDFVAAATVLELSVFSPPTTLSNV